jgi:fumarate reductase subunit D
MVSLLVAPVVILSFVIALPLTDVDVQRIAEMTAAPIVRLLEHRGLLEQKSADSAMAG